MKKEIIVWKCPECGDEKISKSWTDGDFDKCQCGKTQCSFQMDYLHWKTIHSIHKLKAKRYSLNELLEI